jgi:hypothetical protein
MYIRQFWLTNESIFSVVGAISSFPSSFPCTGSGSFGGTHSYCFPFAMVLLKFALDLSARSSCGFLKLDLCVQPATRLMVGGSLSSIWPPLLIACGDSW